MNIKSNYSPPAWMLPAVAAVATLALCTVCFMLGRNNSDAPDISALELRCDTLSNLAKMRAAELDNMRSALFTVSEALDSIAYAEGMMMNVRDPETNRPLSKQALRERIDNYARFIERQRLRIEELEQTLNADGIDAAGIRELQAIVAHLRTQLHSKEQQIARMQAEISGNHTTIARLQKNVDELNVSLSAAESLNENLKQAMTVQDAILNDGYIAIGTSSQLAQAGLLSNGGFLKKRKLNHAAFSPDKFSVVDIRQCRDISISGKKVRVLTSMPKQSYTISGSKGSWTIHILDPTLFWSVSNYLVIQTN